MQDQPFLFHPSLLSFSDINPNRKHVENLMNSRKKRSSASTEYVVIPSEPANTKGGKWPKGVPVPKPGAFQEHHKWDDDALEKLRTFYPTHGDVYCSWILGRTIEAIRLKASRLGVRRTKQWTEEEQAQFERKALEKSQHTYAQHFPTPPPNSLKNHRLPWTADDEKILRQYYTTHGTVYTAAMLKRTPGATQMRAQTLGLPGFDAGRMERLRNEMAEVKQNVDPAQPDALPPFVPSSSQHNRILKSLGRRRLEEIARELGTTERELSAYLEEQELVPKPVEEAWTKEEDRLLRSMWKKHPPNEIGQALRRSTYAIKRRAHELRINLGQMRWTEKEDTLLRKHYGTMRTEELAQRLNRSTGAVQNRASTLGLTSGRVPPRLWSAEEDAILRKEHETMSVEELSKKLDRTVVAIYSRIQSLGLSSRQWQRGEDEKLRELHGKTSRKEIARILNRTVGGIEKRSRVLKLPLIGSPPKYHWDRSNDKELRRLAKTMSIEELSEHFGFPRYHIRYQLKRLKAK